ARGAGGQAMSEIQKFSLVYDPAEDRIALDTEDDGGATMRLWLTQRLCRGLVGAFAPAVQKSLGAEIPPQHEAAVQAFEQAAAMQDFGKVAGVQPKAGSTVGLVHTVHITPTTAGFTLAFEFGQRRSVPIGLGVAQARQTLAVIYQLYVAAGWPLDVWPGWIADPPQTAPIAALN
ncbi:MAG TPA: hypothetical protein VG939_18380, partial [Caulobacteraceae bacterium]|nr:hypothetical protein [Caulobacteraceae bacterium]